MKLRLLSLTAVATIALALIAQTVEPVASAVKETSSFDPTISKPSKPPNPVPEGMVWIPGGEFSMGSEGKCGGKSCCSPATIADALPIRRVDLAEPKEKKRVQYGGSYLCTDQYCTRYMVGTRGKGEVNTGTNYLGFRCAMTVQNSLFSLSNDKP